MTIRKALVSASRYVASVGLVVSLLPGCAWRCAGMSVPNELWLRGDRPGLAWTTPDGGDPLGGVAVLAPPDQMVGGTVVTFAPEARWVICREASEWSAEPTWWRYYVSVDARSDADGVQWVRLRSE